MPAVRDCSVTIVLSGADVCRKLLLLCKIAEYTLLKIHAAIRSEQNALIFESSALYSRTPEGGRRSKPALAVHNPVRRYIQIFGSIVHRLPDSSRTVGRTQQKGNLPVGHHFSLRYAGNDLINSVKKLGLLHIIHLVTLSTVHCCVFAFFPGFMMNLSVKGMKNASHINPKTNPATTSLA